MLSLDQIYHASYALRDVVRKTNLIRSPKINTSCEVYLKPENLQVTGSFKVRGAGYMISQLTPEEKERGVIACSAGNHAQGVALAATKYGIKSVICLPDGAPISKVEATKGYGAEVCMVEGVYDDAYRRALELRDEKGYTLVPLSLYFSGKNAKVEIGLCRGKKLYDKRDSLAEKQVNREMDRRMRDQSKYD